MLYCTRLVSRGGTTSALKANNLLPNGQEREYAKLHERRLVRLMGNSVPTGPAGNELSNLRQQRNKEDLHK